MTRFFVDSTNISDGFVQLSNDDMEHIRVLRIRSSELFIVCDSAGNDYICKLTAQGSDIADVVEIRPSVGEPSIACSIYIALAKSDKMEFVVQKSVELGAVEIILFPSARSVAVPKDITKRTTRLERIALEAAKQSGRGIVPIVFPMESFQSAMDRASKSEISLFLYENEKKIHLKEALELHSEASVYSIVSGPEGGFEPAEVEYANLLGLLSVSLGPRILRCETAPIVALSAVMYQSENL
ncbi:MAG: 16S rRNA (uracil(1498)-N(3))-methyltransferase [Oscillospiraceae bacterium]|nr:16S rRNA (uracil(1498)-N(3))-methyltransferase [Oscillospiraceae bacterium]